MTGDSETLVSSRALRWLFVADVVSFALGGALLFIEGYETRGVFFMAISAFGFWRTWRMWKGDHLSPFLRNLPILVVLPSLGLFLVVSGVIDLVHDRTDDGYTKLGGAILAVGIFAFVLYRSMREQRSRQLTEDAGSAERSGGSS